MLVFCFCFFFVFLFFFVFFQGYWYPIKWASKAHLRFHATRKRQRNMDPTVEIAMITRTNTLNNDMKWFSFVFLQEHVPSDSEVGFVQKMKAWTCNAFHPHKQYLLSGNLSWSGADKGDYGWRWLNSDNCWERKENTHGSGCAWIFDIFDKSSRVCLTLSGHMLQQTQDLYYDVLCVFSPSCVIHSSSWDQDKINNVKGD